MSRSLTVSWDDPQAGHDASLRLSGIEYPRELIAGRIALPPIMKLIGFRFATVEEGLVVFECEPGEQHYNTIGVVHGGLAMTLLDSAMGRCVHTRLPLGKGYTTLEVKAFFTINGFEPVFQPREGGLYSSGILRLSRLENHENRNLSQCFGPVDAQAVSGLRSRRR